MDDPAEIFIGFILVAPVLYLVNVKAILHLIDSFDFSQAHALLVLVNDVTRQLQAHSYSEIHFLVLWFDKLHVFWVILIQGVNVFLQLFSSLVHYYNLSENWIEVVV